MRHLTLVRSAALFAVVTLFSACGSDSSGPTFDDTFTADDVEGPAFGVAFGSESMMETLHWGGPDVGIFAPPFLSALGVKAAPARRHPSRLPALSAGTSLKAQLSALQAAAPGCAVSGHGSDDNVFTPYDGNGNDIGDDFYLRIDCAGVDSIGEGVAVNWKEWGELRIKERSGVLWGWDASSKQGYSDKRSDGLDHDDGVEEYSEHLVVTADRGEFGQTFHSAENGLDGVEPYDDAQGGDLTMVFTAADDPILFHQYYPPGTATLTGRLWLTDLEGPNLDWQIRTLEPLEWSAECADLEGQPFEDGTITVTLNGNSQKGFNISAGPCGAGWDLQIFGDDDPVPTGPRLQVRGFTLPKR